MEFLLVEARIRTMASFFNYYSLQLLYLAHLIQVILRFERSFRLTGEESSASDLYEIAADGQEWSTTMSNTSIN